VEAFGSFWKMTEDDSSTYYNRVFGGWVEVMRISGASWLKSRVYLMALPASLYLRFSMWTVASLTELCGLKRWQSSSMNTRVEDNQAVDMKPDEPWVTVSWNQSSAEPFR